jgi:hypothetical protein
MWIHEMHAKFCGETSSKPVIWKNEQMRWDVNIAMELKETERKVGGDVSRSCSVAGFNNRVLFPRNSLLIN